MDNINISTLAQAEAHLIEVGAIDLGFMTVEGKKLLEVCGFSVANSRAEIARQIDRHRLTAGLDYSCSMVATPSGQRAKVYHFSVNAANHVLLAAMTDKGRSARQEAIDTKIAQQYQIPKTYAAALLEAGRLALELEQAEEQLAIAAPKVDFFDNYVDQSGTFSFRNTAKILKVKENVFKDFLINSKAVYISGKTMIPYSCHIDCGRFEVKTGSSDSGHAFKQMLFTAKGVAWIDGLMSEANVTRKG